MEGTTNVNLRAFIFIWVLFDLFMTVRLQPRALTIQIVVCLIGCILYSHTVPLNFKTPISIIMKATKIKY